MFKVIIETDEAFLTQIFILLREARREKLEEKTVLYQGLLDILSAAMQVWKEIKEKEGSIVHGLPIDHIAYNRGKEKCSIKDKDEDLSHPE